MPEGPALHRGSEYNRRTGCGKTARPGLYGGCRVTGIPTVEAVRSEFFLPLALLLPTKVPFSLMYEAFNLLASLLLSQAQLSG